MCGGGLPHVGGLKRRLSALGMAASCTHETELGGRRAARAWVAQDSLAVNVAQQQGDSGRVPVM